MNKIMQNAFLIKCKYKVYIDNVIMSTQIVNIIQSNKMYVNKLLASKILMYCL